MVKKKYTLILMCKECKIPNCKLINQPKKAYLLLAFQPVNKTPNVNIKKNSLIKFYCS